MGHKNAWKSPVLAADLRPLWGTDDFEADATENILVWEERGTMSKIFVSHVVVALCYMTLGDVTWRHDVTVQDMK